DRALGDTLEERVVRDQQRGLQGLKALEPELVPRAGADPAQVVISPPNARGDAGLDIHLRLAADVEEQLDAKTTARQLRHPGSDPLDERRVRLVGVVGDRHAQHDRRRRAAGLVRRPGPARGTTTHGRRDERHEDANGQHAGPHEGLTIWGLAVQRIVACLEIGLDEMWLATVSERADTVTIGGWRRRSPPHAGWRSS